MSKKQLVSADVVRAAAKRGEKVIYVTNKNSIVTSEATSTAKALGIALTVREQSAIEVPGKEEVVDAEVAVRRALADHTGGEIREDLLAEVMRRVALERGSKSPAGVRKLASIQVVGAAQGGGTVISTLDLTTLLENQTIPSATGFMTWTNSFVKFNRKHEEVLVVLDGELQFRMGKETVTAVVGDVMLIPKNLQLEIGTTRSVRLFYASYNA